MAKYELEDLQKLVSDPKSDVHLKKSTQNINLEPWDLQNIKKAVTRILDRNLWQYDKLLDGLILGYQNVKCLGDKAPCRRDSSYVVVPTQAEFYVFQPKIGNIYKGVVQKISVAHVGCLLYDHFNVSLPIPPGKEDLLKTLTPQTEVSFVLEVQDFTSVLPFFKGQLVGLKSNSGDQSAEKERRKDSVGGSENSLSLVKCNADLPDMKKADKESKPALVKSQSVMDPCMQMIDGQRKLTLKLREGSDVKPDKKKQRLSLKQIASSEEAKKDKSSEEDDSDHLITPYQRPSENRKSNLINQDDDTLKYEKMRRTLESMRVSPLKELAVSDDDLSDSSLDLQKVLEDFSSKISKSSQNSQPTKASQSKTQEKSQRVLPGFSSPEANVLSKSSGSKNNGSHASKSVLAQKADDSSSEDENESPSFPSESQSKAKVEPQKAGSALSLAKPDIQARSPGGKSCTSQAPKLIPKVKVDDTSSEDDDSNSEVSEGGGRKTPFVVETSPLKGKYSPIGTSTQKSPEKTLPFLKEIFTSSEDEKESSSEDSEDENTKPVPPQTPTKQTVPQKGMSTTTGNNSKASSIKSGSALSLAKSDVPTKSPGGVNSKSEAPKSNLPLKTDDTSSEDEESGSEESDDGGRKQHVLPLSPTKRTSPQKEKITPTESQSKIKAKSRKSSSALSLARPDTQIKSPGVKSSGSQAPKSNLPLKTGDTSSEDEDDSNSKDFEGDIKKSQVVVQTSRLMGQNSPLASSTQKSPQKKSSSANIWGRAESEVSSSDDESEEEVSSLAGSTKETDKPSTYKQPSPAKKRGSSTSTDTDSDNDEDLKSYVSNVIASASKPAEESSSKESDSLPEMGQEKSSDSIGDPKTSAQIRSGNPRPRKSTAPAKDSSSNDSSEDKPAVTSTGKTSYLPENTISDSDSDGDIAARSHTQTPCPTKPLSIKGAFKLPQMKSILSHTFLDGSVHGKSPLACSTPTAVSSNKNLLMQSLKRPFVADTRDVQKMDEPKKKKKKESKTSNENKDQLKLTDSGFQDLRVKAKKKNEDATKEGKREEPRPLPEAFELDVNKHGFSDLAKTKTQKKSKKKSEPEVLSIEATMHVSSQPLKLVKDKRNSSKTKDTKHLVEALTSVGVKDLERKQSEAMTPKPADGTEAMEDNSGRKSKKRKLSEVTEEKVGRESLPDPDFCKKELKKRKLFTPNVDDSPSIIDVSRKTEEPALKSHSSKPKKSKKKKTAEVVVGAVERLPPGETDSKIGNEESRIFTSESLNTGSGTCIGLKKEEPKIKGSLEDQFGEDDTLNRLIMDIRNQFFDEVCDKKKKKKKTKNTEAVATVKSTYDVAPPVEVIEQVKKKEKKKKRAADEIEGKQSVQDSASALKSDLVIGTLVDSHPAPKSHENLVSEKKSKKKKEKLRDAARELLPSSPVESAELVKKRKTDETKPIDEKLKKKTKEKLSKVPSLPARELSPSLSVHSDVSAKKKKTDKQTARDEKSKKKKAEKPSSVATEPARELSPSFSVYSAVSAMEKRTDETAPTAEKLKKKKKEKLSKVAPITARELSPTSSVHSAVSSKEKKSVETKPTAEKSKKKKKEKPSNTALTPSPALAVDFAVPLKKKKIATTVESPEAKVSVQKEKKRREKEPKMKTPSNEVAAGDQEDSLDVDDVLQSLMKNFLQGFSENKEEKEKPKKKKSNH